MHADNVPCRLQHVHGGHILSDLRCQPDCQPPLHLRGLPPGGHCLWNNSHSVNTARHRIPFAHNSSWIWTSFGAGQLSPSCIGMPITCHLITFTWHLACWHVAVLVLFSACLFHFAFRMLSEGSLQGPEAHGNALALSTATNAPRGCSALAHSGPTICWSARCLGAQNILWSVHLGRHTPVCRLLLVLCVPTTEQL